MTVSALEITAREILDKARSDDNIWTPTTAAILNVFQARYAWAFPAARVEAIACALEDICSFPAMQKCLTKLVRAETLRSRRINGVTHYEINFPNPR